MTKTKPTLDLSKYRTLIFDCDGVILNSNPIKTEAFYQAALPYGEEAAVTFRDYHVRNGGISRYLKVDWFLTEVIGQSEPDPELRQTLLDVYAHNVWQGMLTCEVDEAIFKLREQTSHVRWMVASGGDEQELREIFQIRGLDQLFDGGIYGSPRTKEEIFADIELATDAFRPAVFLGDSHYDAEVSRISHLNFLFVSHWSEVKPPESVSCIESLRDCLQCL